MKKSVLIVAVLLAGVAVAHGQLPPPAPQLARFDVLLGNWVGEGIVRAGAGGTEQKWKAAQTYSKILDGYAIQADLRIDVGAESPASILIRSIYSWDPASERFLQFDTSNAGSASFEPVYWTDDGKLVGSSTMTVHGVPVVEQWVITVEKDAYKIRIDRSVAGGPFFVHVDGSLRKGGKGFSLADAADQSGPVPAPQEMVAMQRQAGKWRFQGKVAPMPGMDPIEVSGIEESRTTLGGHVQLGTIRGDEMPGAPKAFEAIFALAWDAEARCYLSFGIDNMGGVGIDKGYLTGENRMVCTGAHVIYGVPQTLRTVIAWDASGEHYTIQQDRCPADAPPDKAFEAKYTRIKS